MFVAEPLLMVKLSAAVELGLMEVGLTEPPQEEIAAWEELTQRYGQITITSIAAKRAVFLTLLLILVYSNRSVYI